MISHSSSVGDARNNIQNYFTYALEAAGNLVVHTQLKRIADIVEHSIKLTVPVEEYSRYALILKAVKAVQNITNFSFLFTLLEMWRRPINSEQIINKEALIEEINASLNEALKDKKIFISTELDRRDEKITLIKKFLGLEERLQSKDVIKFIVMISLKNTFKDKYKNEKDFKEKLLTHLNSGFKNLTIDQKDNQTVQISEDNLRTIHITPPTFLEKLFWIGCTSATIAGAAIQGEEWGFYTLPSFAKIAEKTGAVKLFGSVNAPCSLDTFIHASLTLGNLAKLFETTRRLVKINDEAERAHNWWEVIYATGGAIVYGAAWARCAPNAMSWCVIGVRAAEIGADLVKPYYQPAVRF